MSNKRIRYVEKDNKLISISDIVSEKGSKYSVTIDLENCTYRIKNLLSHRGYEGGQDINNMNVLKRTIKKHLQHLGIKFEKEVRQRSFGLCSRGFTEAQNREQKRLEKENKSPINNDGEN